jgi:hypothetical protein
LARVALAFDNSHRPNARENRLISWSATRTRDALVAGCTSSTFKGYRKIAKIEVGFSVMWEMPIKQSLLHRTEARKSNMQSFGLTDFEHRRHQLISPQRFVLRLLIAIGLWLVLAVVGLLIGMAGYSAFEDMSLTDAYVNAAMILSGMGPLGELKTTAGKIFAGSYAIFSGLVLVIATGFVLAPIFHRVLHRFHVETGKEE